MLKQKDTALLIFTRTPAEEALSKNFTGNKAVKQNSRIARLLAQHTIHEANVTGLPVFTITSAQQTGSNFGERFTNAITDVFEHGYNKVICIGTDTPDISYRHIQQVAALLTTNDYVAGPSADGGIYILGLNKKVFDKTTLTNIKWQSSSVYKELLEHFTSEGSGYAVTECLADIDNSGMLYNWLSGSAHTLTIALSGILNPAGKSGINISEKVFISYAHLSELYRGPPLLASIAA